MKKILSEWAAEKAKALTLQMKAVQRDIERLEQEKAEIAMRREMYIDLRDNPPDDLPDSSPLRLRIDVVDEEEDEGAPSATEAVDMLLAERPGLTRGDVRDLLADEIETSSDDPRRVITAALSRRVKTGDLIEDEEGRLWPRDTARAREELVERGDLPERSSDEELSMTAIGRALTKSRLPPGEDGE